MFVTREADYAVRCVLLLTREAGRVVSANEISKTMSVPRTFLAKILQRLLKKGILKSTQGISGGYELARSPAEINLFDVIDAIQGPSAMTACAIDEKACSLSCSCVVHPVWVELRQEVEKRLKSESFAGLIGKG